MNEQMLLFTDMLILRGRPLSYILAVSEKYSDVPLTILVTVNQCELAENKI